MVEVVSRWRRLGISLLVVAACLYLPFFWIPGALQPGELTYRSAAWFKLWSILPGFSPGIYFFHPNERAEFLVMTGTTVGLLVLLTWLGAAGRWRLGAAGGLALLVSVPTSQLAYACLAF